MGHDAAGCAHLDRPTRQELSRQEATLGELEEELDARLAAVRATVGRTETVVLAESALLAVHESVDWARRYRKYATLRERQERVGIGAQGMLGAVDLLRRLEASTREVG